MLFSHEVSVDQLQRGDHIYAWRRFFLYTHHGIYVGDGKVIHFGRTGGTSSELMAFKRPPRLCPECSAQGSDVVHGLISTCMECFLSRSASRKIRRYEYGVSKLSFALKRPGTCTMASSDQPEVVVYRAIYLLNKGFGEYHLLRNNCEDFALYCKTGKIVLHGRLGGSTQVNDYASFRDENRDISTHPLALAVAVEDLYDERRIAQSENLASLS